MANRATDDDRPGRGWRGSPDAWLDAAEAMLVEQGVDAVKILPLSARLKLSRTSFYWFFKDRQQLLEALLDRWEAATTDRLVAATGDFAATETEAMLNVIAAFLSEDGFDARLELAIRNWAQQSPVVLDRLQQADSDRLSSLRRLLEYWGHHPDDADTRARTVYLVQIGYVSMRVEEDIAERLRRIPHYVEIYTGKRPSDSEMARFTARIGVVALDSAGTASET